MKVLVLMFVMLAGSQVANACVDFSGTYKVEDPFYSYFLVTQKGCDNVFVSKQQSPDPQKESEGSYYQTKPYYSVSKGQFNDVGAFSTDALMDNYFFHTSQIMYSDENGIYAFNALTTYQKLKNGDIEERTILSSTREGIIKTNVPEIKIWKKI